MIMRLIQYVTEANERAVGLVLDPDTICRLQKVNTLYQLAVQAIETGSSIEAQVQALRSDNRDSYGDIMHQHRILSPIDHRDPAHLLVSGTGLTHLGSADTRDAMHLKNSGHSEKSEPLTDSMKMFKMGVEGGKPAAGETGVQPEWFFKGNGNIIARPEASLESPAFALDAGEEPEIAGIYINDNKGTPCRIGFALGNEFSDHKTERQNYLYLAHSKLRPCAIGPELLVGPLPDSIEGKSRIVRDGNVIWEKRFLSGEQNMSHSIANLEYHHFKYSNFCNPGDVNVHFFGTATLSFGDGIETAPGDIFEIDASIFGRPLRNTLTLDERTTAGVRSL